MKMSRRLIHASVKKPTPKPKLALKITNPPNPKSTPIPKNIPTPVPIKRSENAAILLTCMVAVSTLWAVNIFAAIMGKLRENRNSLNRTS